MLGVRNAEFAPRFCRGESLRSLPFAHRFATEHTKLRDDEDFWERCGEHFSDELLADLALSCAMWIGMGRTLRTLDIGQSCKITLPSRA